MSLVSGMTSGLFAITHALGMRQGLGSPRKAVRALLNLTLKTQFIHTMAPHRNDSDRGAMGVRMVQGTLGATMGPPALME